MSVNTEGSAGSYPRTLTPCLTAQGMDIIKVNETSHINVTFPKVPEGLQGPFNVSISYVQDYVIKCIGNVTSERINTTWYEYDVHQFQWGGSTLGTWGDSFVFGLIGPESDGQHGLGPEYPLWLSNNYTISNGTDKGDGAGLPSVPLPGLKSVLPGLAIGVMLFTGLYM